MGLENQMVKLHPLFPEVMGHGDQAWHEDTLDDIKFIAGPQRDNSLSHSHLGTI